MCIRDSLYTDGTYQAELRSKFGDTFNLTFHLSPPLIAGTDPNTGEPRKIAFSGRWILPLLSMLKGFKGLRGTAFDLFGRTEERRGERDFIGTVEGIMAQVAAKATPENVVAAQALIDSTLHVRGFGPVKARNLEEFEAKRPELERGLDGTDPEARAPTPMAKAAAS